jgi:hypothetical protein
MCKSSKLIGSWQRFLFLNAVLWYCTWIEADRIMRCHVVSCHDAWWSCLWVNFSNVSGSSLACLSVQKVCTIFLINRIFILNVGLVVLLRAFDHWTVLLYKVNCEQFWGISSLSLWGQGVRQKIYPWSWSCSKPAKLVRHRTLEFIKCG